MTRSGWFVWLGLCACGAGETTAGADVSSTNDAGDTVVERALAGPSQIPVLQGPVSITPETVVLGDYRSASGRVVDKWGAPIEGATVTAEAGRLSWTTLSGVNGHFEFAALIERGLRFTAETDDGVATRWVGRAGPIAALVLVMEPAATVVVTSAFPELRHVVVRHIPKTWGTYASDDAYDVGGQVDADDVEVISPHHEALRARYGARVVARDAREIEREQDIVSRGNVGQVFRLRADVPHAFVVSIDGEAHGERFELACGETRLSPGEALELACGARGRMRVTGRVVDLHGEPIVAMRVALSDPERTVVERSERHGGFRASLMLDRVSDCTVTATIDWENFETWPTARRMLPCRPGGWIDLGDWVIASPDDMYMAANLVPFDFWRHMTIDRHDDYYRHEFDWEHSRSHGIVPERGFRRWGFAMCMWCGRFMERPIWEGIDERRLLDNLGMPSGMTIEGLDRRRLAELGIADVLAWRLLEPGALLELVMRDSEGNLHAREIDPAWLFGL